MKKVPIFFKVICLFIFYLIYECHAYAQRLPILSDFMRIKSISNPDISKSGDWVVYALEENVNSEEAISNIWLVSYDGQVSKQLTDDKKNSNFLPKWSPDGQWIAFLSENEETKDNSLKLLSKQNGLMITLTKKQYDISDFVWSPDSQDIAFIASETKDENDPQNKPIVIKRYSFKEDELGYLRNNRSRLYRINLKTKQIKLLTPGSYDNWSPSWSPNGKYIAFVTKRKDNPDRNFNSDIYLINLNHGNKITQLTHYPGSDLDEDWDSDPSWSPDSSQIASIRSAKPQLIYYDYAPTQLVTIDIKKDKSQILAPIDRWFYEPKWSDDGTTIYALIETSRNTHLNAINVSRGTVTALTSGTRVDSDFSVAKKRIVVVSSDDQHPDELYAVENGLRALTHHNQKLIEEVQFLPLEDIDFDSFDGQKIEGLLLKPAHYIPGTLYPGILNLHGGPVSQFSHEFNFEWQWLAAQGYTVIAPNPRGSSGRGFRFAKAIIADWGNLDVKDVLAATDYVISKKIVDPNRLGVSGWSYGAMLTDYVIASTTRFKAAVSGAGTGNLLGNYGVDEYTLSYESELGKPWLNTTLYLKLSYPFMNANRIKTPTLFMCDSLDYNMPCEGSEQLYQALRSLKIPTELVIYPDQYHTLDRPDFEMDCMQRSKDWMDLYLKPKVNK